MAAARKSRQDVVDAVDEVEDVVDGDADPFAEDEVLDADAFADEFEEEPEESDGEELEADNLEGDVLEVDPDAEGEDLEAGATVAPPPEATFDDEDDDKIVTAVTGEDDEDEVEGLREGEFVCRSCYMAKRDTQLADPEQLLCRDCA